MLEVALKTTPVATLVTATVALGMAAPLASKTDPTRSPLIACANSDGATVREMTRIRTGRLRALSIGIWGTPSRLLPIWSRADSKQDKQVMRGLHPVNRSDLT